MLLPSEINLWGKLVLCHLPLTLIAVTVASFLGCSLEKKTIEIKTLLALWNTR